MIKTMKNFNLSLNKYIYLVYRMFGDRTWDRIGYLICIVRDRLSTDFEKLGGVTPPHTPHNVRPWPRNTRRICNRLDAFETVSWICSSHFRLFWIVSPSTLCERTVSTGCPSIVRGINWGVSPRKLTQSSLHFLILTSSNYRKPTTELN